ncbi:MAG: hypothetical protein APR62_06070 [Smithella sp. SDB]|nr:MAG: hypothetical protein APR62_06070 [Smithella sp. SDB]
MNNKIIKSTPFGSVCIVWSGSKDQPLIVNILLSMPDFPAENRAVRLFPDSQKCSCKEIDKIASSISAYLEGENISFPFDIVDISRCSEFQRSVLRAQYAIPRGRVSTYGLIAAHVGLAGGARAVGNVMAANPFPLIIPCHRTILSGHQLGGFGGGIEMKQALLTNEGVIFDEKGRVICRRLHYAST